MAGTTGLEPATSAVTGQRSNQLSYVPSLGWKLSHQREKLSTSDSLRVAVPKPHTVRSTV